MSEHNFYVTALPRSGTAWLSQMLSHGGECFCFHECERDLLHGSPDDQRDIVRRRLYQKHHMFSGNVSSGMLAWTLPPSDGPVVIIQRDWEDVENSIRFAMVEWGIREMDVDTTEVEDIYNIFCENHPHALVVSFDDLFNLDTMVKIWSHCVPLMAPVDKFTELLRHKITIKNFDYTVAPAP